MSSDFYPSSLSRNLVSAGTFGYGENAALRRLLNVAEDATRHDDGKRGSAVNFVAYPDFGHKAGTGRQAVFLGRSRFRTGTVSFGKHPLVGPHPK